VTLDSPRNRGDIQVATEGKSLKTVTSFDSSCGSSVAASALSSSFGASGSSVTSSFNSSEASGSAATLSSAPGNRSFIQLATEGKSLKVVTSCAGNSSCFSGSAFIAVSSEMSMASATATPFVVSSFDGSDIASSSGVSSSFGASGASS